MAMQAQSNRNCFLVERALGIHSEMNVCKCGAAVSVNDEMFVAIKNGTYFTRCLGRGRVMFFPRTSSLPP